MKYTILFIVWLSLMGYGFFKPVNEGSHLFFNGEDKLIHFGLFFGAAFLQLLSSRLEWLWSSKLAISITLVFGIAFAFGTEWFQQFVPSRTSDFKDTFFDILGSFGGVFFFVIFQKRNQSLGN